MAVVAGEAAYGLYLLGGALLLALAAAMPKPKPSPPSWPEAANDNTYGDPKPVPNPPPQPPPDPPPKIPPVIIGPMVAILVANAYLNKYFDKSKLTEECKDVLKKYRVHQYRNRKQFTDSPDEASHHALQNAMLEFPRGSGGIADICPGYKEGDGVSIPLDDSKGGVHKQVGDMQEIFARKHRKAGTQPTYQQAREELINQLTKAAGLSPKEAECIAKYIDEIMSNICPDLVNKNLPMRTPL